MKFILLKGTPSISSDTAILRIEKYVCVTELKEKNLKAY
jgi:hypothetical protein